ncbi:MAG TPA: UvrD-helicase domain-containing protein [Bryobacteraceae bacterium]|nr:UvrD-helicase domain-containing protein [Bryobacteraceae bacterium]
MILSDAQRAAVERVNQDVCVVAGPGSGKTRVLIERFAWLVEFHHLDPSRILAITFTEKAATEIKERLIKRFANSPEHREPIERAWVSTIDGFCARLLQENAIAAGVAPDFAVLEQPVAERLARDSAEESLDELFEEDPGEMRRLLEALDLSTDDGGRKPDLAASLLDVYESMRLYGLDELPPIQPSPNIWPEARRLARIVLDDKGSSASDTPTLRDWATKFLALPPIVTKEHFALEFTAHTGRVGKTRADNAKALKNEILPALLAQWIEIWNEGLLHLLREAVARLDRRYRKKKRDRSALDFADLEEESIRLLDSNYFICEATRNRFDQILMDELQDTNRLQWRLLNLIRTPDSFFAVGDINQSIYGFRHADPAVFEEYRRGLEASGAAIDDLRENHRSRQTILDTVSRVLDGQPGIEPRPLIASKTFPAISGPTVERLVGEGEDVEASMVAARIRELNYEYKDVAVLVRSLNSLDPFTRAFDRFDIPFVITGGRTFLDAREIRDLVSFLNALVNPLDEISLVGVLRSPIVGFSDEEIFRLGKTGWQEIFQTRFGRLRKQAGFVSPDRLLPIQPDLSPRARANVDKLCSWLRREHRNRPRPLAEMLDDLVYLSEAEASPPEAGNVVQLMSIHSAKGLEFKVVFVSALHRPPEKNSPVIAFSHGIGAKWRNPATGESQPDTAYAALKQERKKREEEEANRLLYVAMTRAEERLFLTYTKGKNSRGWQKLVESTVAAEFSANTVIPAPPGRETNGVDVQLVNPPAVPRQHDSGAAVTAVAMFRACPRKYFLSKYIGMEPQESQAASVGSEVHEILAGGTSNLLEAQELAMRFPMPSHPTQIEHEFDFMFAVEDVVLRGQIDLWYEQDGELVLVDFKTDREEEPESYSLQLRFYALALERYAGRLPDRAMLFYLRSGRAVEISLSLNDLKSAISALHEFLNSQNSMVFPLREGEHCFRCEFYKGLCPAGKN